MTDAASQFGSAGHNHSVLYRNEVEPLTLIAASLKEIAFAGRAAGLGRCFATRSVCARYFRSARRKVPSSWKGSHMQVTLMKGKIHRARVTECDLHYEGSISIDLDLIDAAGFMANERVDIYDIDNGNRFSTYVIEAPRGSRTIGLNGAAARLVAVGDRIIIVAYASFERDDARMFQPEIVVLNEENERVRKVSRAC